jgi:three-Cys-motif partner protein
MKNSRIDFNTQWNSLCLKKCNNEKRKETTQDDLCRETLSISDNLPVRCVGGWAMQKIFHLIQYFGIFTIGMKSKWQGNINYIEICSGPGRCVNRENGEEFNGTSICIIEHQASEYLKKILFFDYNEKVVDTLNKRISDRNAINAKAYIGDYNKPNDICAKIIEETKGVGLNLVFIDPTDCSVPFTLLKKIKERIINVDFIVNFAIRTDVNRNIRNAVLHPETHQNAVKKYTTFLGSNDFFYNPKVIETANKGSQQDLRKLFRDEYMNSLKKIGYSHFDFKPIENYYDLVFASSHETGIKFWSKANAIGFDGQRSLF